MNVISISLNKDAAKDKLTWTQVSNLKEMKDSIALQYNVTQIPTTYLLDSNGKIVAIDLYGDDLKSKIKKLL